MELDLRDLRALVAIAEVGSLSRAAERLHVTQPALSQQLARIERALGRPLFERGPKGARPTADGMRFLDGARAALAHLQLGREAAHDAAAGRTGRLRICAVDPLFVTFLPSLLSRFRQSFPNVAISVADEHSSVQTDLLRAGEADIGFLNPPVADAGLELRHVAWHRLMLALPRDHDLAVCDVVPVAAIAAHPLIILTEGFGGGRVRRVERLFSEAGVTPRVAQRSENSETMLRLAAIGLGLAIVPEPLAGSGDDRLVFRAIEGGPRVAVSAAWQPGRLTPPARNLLGLLPA